MKILEKTNKRLIELKNGLEPSSHDLKQQYGQLIHAIPSLIGELQKICDNLSPIVENNDQRIKILKSYKKKM